MKIIKCLTVLLLLIGLQACYEDNKPANKHNSEENITSKSNINTSTELHNHDDLSTVNCQKQENISPGYYVSLVTKQDPQSGESYTEVTSFKLYSNNTFFLNDSNRVGPYPFKLIYNYEARGSWSQSENNFALNNLEFKDVSTNSWIVNPYLPAMSWQVRNIYDCSFEYYDVQDQIWVKFYRQKK